MYSLFGSLTNLGIIQTEHIEKTPLKATAQLCGQLSVNTPGPGRDKQTNGLHPKTERCLPPRARQDQTGPNLHGNPAPPEPN